MVTGKRNNFQLETYILSLFLCFCSVQSIPITLFSFLLYHKWINQLQTSYYKEMNYGMGSKSCAWRRRSLHKALHTCNGQSFPFGFFPPLSLSLLEFLWHLRLSEAQTCSLVHALSHPRSGHFCFISPNAQARSCALRTQKRKICVRLGESRKARCMLQQCRGLHKGCTWAAAQGACCRSCNAAAADLWVGASDNKVPTKPVWVEAGTHPRAIGP